MMVGLEHSLAMSNQTPEQLLNKKIQKFVDRLVPNSVIFKPLKKSMAWIAEQVVDMSQWYVEAKIQESKKDEAL